jgi:hypothetical protein
VISPILGIFAGCCASAGKIVARIVASATKIIVFLIVFVFLRSLFLLSSWERIEVRVPCTNQKSPHPCPLPKDEGKKEFQSKIENPK